MTDDYPKTHAAAQLAEIKRWEGTPQMDQTTCDECGATFADGDDGPGPGHDESCSLHPDNISDPLQGRDPDELHDRNR